MKEYCIAVIRGQESRYNVGQAKYLHSKYLGTEVWTFMDLKYLCKFYQLGTHNLKKSTMQNLKISQTLNL